MRVKKHKVEDSKIMIEAMKESLEESPIEIRNCINDCKDLLDNFESISMKHVNRKLTKAHI